MRFSRGFADYDLGRLTWEDAETRLPAADFVLLGLGSIEQHSIHLPLSTDTLRAEALTRELAEAAPDHGLDVVRLPTLPYGYSEHHMNFAGTVTLAADTYQAVLEEVGASVAAHGAERLAFANFHGGNLEPIKLAADRLQRDHGLSAYVVNWTDFARDRLEERFGEGWGHAGDHETSVIELFHPDLVREGKKGPRRGRPGTRPSSSRTSTSSPSRAASATRRPRTPSSSRRWSRRPPRTSSRCSPRTSNRSPSRRSRSAP